MKIATYYSTLNYIPGFLIWTRIIKRNDRLPASCVWVSWRHKSSAHLRACERLLVSCISWLIGPSGWKHQGQGRAGETGRKHREVSLKASCWIYCSCLSHFPDAPTSLSRCIPQWLPPLFSARTRCEGMNETSLIQEDISIWVQVITSEGRWLASRFCKQFYFFNYLFVHISFTAFFTPSTLLHEIVAEFKPK